MEKIAKCLLILFMSISIMGCIEPKQVKADTNNYNPFVMKEINKNEPLVSYNKYTNHYEVYFYELGNFGFEAYDKQELNSLLESYGLIKSYGYTTNSLYVTNSYKKPNGDTIVEYNDLSWCRYNNKSGQYEFCPAITEDYSILFYNMDELEECIKTYKFIKENANC